jgi:ergothioneine biosynthesis protein EgtB
MAGRIRANAIQGGTRPMSTTTISPRAHPATGQADDLCAAYESIRAATAQLAAALSAEDCALQSMPDASPVKWHLAHTSWFFETFVLDAQLPGYRAFDPAFRMLFNSYYVQVGARHPRPERGLVSRPGLAEVLEYRRHVDRGILQWLDSAPRGAALGLLELGLHHEQQHQELILTDLKHLFSRNPLRPAYRAQRPGAGRGGTPALQWQRFPAGVREIGHAGEGFCFDNEQPRHRVYLEAYELASRLATSAEFAAFIDDGGYARPELWLSDGWDTCCAQGWSAPAYWERDGSGWRVFTLHGMRDLEPSEPVSHVSYYEADAFARWSGARLPTEAEWESAAASQPRGGNFLESGALHPVAASAEGPVLQQLFGDVWEWTGSAYLGYPGYRPVAGAVGEYNGKFMVNQFVLRGGSCATPRSHIRPTYRNFFAPSARWQFSGIRLARDV